MMDVFLKKARELDSNDSLASYRNKFCIPDDNVIYLDGNSLGRLPRKNVELLSNVIKDQWGNRLIRSWNEHWMDISGRLASKISVLIGAREDEVFVGDTTSLNLYKLAFAALAIDESKTKIISDVFNFPSDLYVFQGLIKQQFKNHSLHLLKSEDGIRINENEYRSLIDKKTALVSMSHVAFKSSFMYDMQRINQIAHQNEALTLWDLSHSAGAVDLKLNESGADMAVGCTYKYLNGGPGAPAFLYVRKDLQEKLSNPVSAWFSHANPFSFSPDYEAVNGIQRFATGTPSVLSLAAIELGLDISIEAGMIQIREKSIQQIQFLMELIHAFLVPLGFIIATPENSEQRGSHISIQHSEAYRISQAMIEPRNSAKSIIPDFRPPNNIRLGIAPLYNSFIEMYETVLRIQSIVKEGEFEDYSLERKQVT